MTHNCEGYCSPFTYREHTKVIKTNALKAKGISKNRLQELWVTDNISQEDLIIIKFIHDLSYLTSSLITLCFTRAGVSPDLIRLSNVSGKNPYLRSIKKLETLGVIVIYSFSTEDNRVVGSHIYSLSPGAEEWIGILGERVKSYFIQKKETYPSLSTDLFHDRTIYFYKDILSQLAINQCYIQIIGLNRLDLDSYSFVSEGTDGYKCAMLKTFNNRYISLIAPRSIGDDIYLNELLNYLLNWMDEKGVLKNSFVIIIVTDSLESSRLLHSRLMDKGYFDKLTILYVTDFSTFYERDVFSHLIRFTSVSSLTYDTVSMRIGN